MTPYLAHSQKMLEQFSHVRNISSDLLVVYFSLGNHCINSNLLLFFLPEQVPSRVWHVQREASCLHCWHSWNDTDQEGPGAAQWGTTEDIWSPVSFGSNIIIISIYNIWSRQKKIWFYWIEFNCFRLNTAWREIRLGQQACMMVKPRKSPMSSMYLTWLARWVHGYIEI